MKIGDLIDKLTAMREKYGEIEVTIYSDKETNPDREPTDPHVCTVTWHDEKDKRTSVMLCDRYTQAELQ